MQVLDMGEEVSASGCHNEQLLAFEGRAKDRVIGSLAGTPMPG
jgi:hypothetical protein